MSDNSIRTADKTTYSPTSAEGITLTPRADVLEKDEEYLVLLDMPGVKPEDVDVRFEQGELVVVGRRHPSFADKQCLGREPETASYHRGFRLSENVAADQIHAELRDGVLMLHLPKAEKAKPRRIAVKGN